MNPVSEIGIFTFVPGANIQEALAGVEAISSRQEDIRNIRWGGVCTDEETKMQLVADWDDLSYHERYVQSGADYAAVADILGPILAAPPVVFHTHLDQDALGIVLDAPVVEVITFYSVSEGFQDVARGVLSTRCASEGGAGFVDAPVLEEIAQQAGGVNASAHSAAVAWAGRRQDQNQNQDLDWVLPGAGGVERHNVRFDA
ncbi:hypothetical protein BDW62DRAFT_199753 [Aspergillus aurantiobrunneus]